MKKQMQINIDLLTPLSEFSKGKTLSFKIQKNSTIQDIIELLNKKFGPKFKLKLIRNNKLNQAIMIMRNGTNVSDNLSIKLTNNDKLTFCAVIGGG